MQREAHYTDYLERRYEYSAWKAAADVESQTHLTMPAFRGDELPGWSLQRASKSRQLDGTPLVRGFWVADGDPERVLDVEVFDCSRACGARAFMLTLLGDMQGATASREPAESLGDVAFRLGGDKAVVFARRNVVVRIRNAGNAVASGIAPARALDNRLTGRVT